MSGTITATASIDSGPNVPAELTIEVERIDVTTATKTRIDPAWEFVDVRGHFHAWAHDETLPTLDARSEHVDCDAGHSDDEYDCEGYDVTVYSCLICGEIIEPETITTASTFRETAPGRMSWTVVVHHVVEYERDRRLSVVFHAGDTTYFGVAAVVGGRRTVPDSPHSAPRSTTTLFGAGPLGRRKTVAVAA